ncbi:MAG TPA: hypothetical protein VFO79_10090 [Xanthomonadales bacterium]|nr:hypothetical protein [Xanthomonadales bacterium]
MADGTDAVAALDAEDLAWSDARSRIRNAETERRTLTPRQRRLLLGIALAHLVLALLVRESMRPPDVFRAAAVDEQVMYFDFVPEPAAPAPDPAASIHEPRATPEPVTRVQPIVPTRRDDAPMTATFVPSEPAVEAPPKLRLFNADGSVIVPDGADAPPAPGWRERVAGESPLFEGRSALPVRRTRLNRYWKPEGETLGQEIVRKYPLAAIILGGVGVPKCPPRSTHPDCEGEAQPQRFDEIVPDGF